MRKSLTLSAAAVAAAVTLGSPAVAFAADSPAHSVPMAPVKANLAPDGPAHSVPAAPITVPAAPIKANPAEDLSITLTPAQAKPGDKVTVAIKGAEDLKNVTLSSSVLKDEQVQGDVGTGIVDSKAKAGDASVTVSGTAANGKEVSANATLKVTVPDAPVKPAPSEKPMLPVKPVPSEKPMAPVKPVPSEKTVVPRGSVDTGMAPVASSSGTADLTAGGIAAAGGAALLGLTLLNRRRSRNDA